MQRVHYVLTEVADQIYDATGVIIHSLGAGPDPSKNGKLAFFKWVAFAYSVRSSV